MSESRDERFTRIMSGADGAAGAKALRAMAACAEPIYAGMMRARNALYDTGVFASHDLGRPTVAVGNITTGGTGKTPTVIWLARKLAEAGMVPAVLLRGYKSGDETAIYHGAGLRVVADPDRRRGAAAALRQYPETGVLVLDDAMQHRRAKRAFNLVLVNGAEPFGLGRVFPRGLLREPLAGLRRADAILITHAGEAKDLQAIERTVRNHNPQAAIFRADHRLDQFHGVDSVAGKSVLAFCGIGSPISFFARLKEIGANIAGTRTFADHHAYTPAELTKLREEARRLKAELLVTTEKDFVKLREWANGELPLAWAGLRLEFAADNERQLLGAVLKAVGKGPA